MPELSAKESKTGRIDIVVTPLDGEGRPDTKLINAAAVASGDITKAARLDPNQVEQINEHLDNATDILSTAAPREVILPFVKEVASKKYGVSVKI